VADLPIDLAQGFAELDAAMVELKAGLEQLRLQMGWALESDETWLARTIQGEGAGLLGPQRDEAGRWVAWSVLTRVGHAWWPTTVWEVVTPPSGYHGCHAVDEPEPWARALAGEALAQWAAGELKADGPPWMLSLVDVERIKPAIEPDRAFVHGRWGLAFYWNNPFPKAKEEQDGQEIQDHRR